MSGHARALTRKDSELRHLALTIEKLKARLDKQLRDRFGASAEGIEQLQLVLEDLEITRSAEVPAADVPGASKDTITARARSHCSPLT